jgi:RNA polymerase sigma-70 factor (ECF subfamily)
VVSSALEPGKAAAFDEDVIVLDRVIAGDKDAFQVIYERYHDKVQAIARGILLDVDEAHDVVQEIFTLVFRHCRRFDRRSRFSTWVYRVAVNRATQQARRNRFKRFWVPMGESFDRAEPEHTPTYTDPKIDRALAKLAPSDRAILTLFYWDELNLTEIGEALSCSANAAKTRLFRARERFRQFFEEEG